MNGKTKLIMWLAGCLFTIVVCLVIPALANGIIQNDRNNTAEHTKIRHEVKQDKEEVIEKMQHGFDKVHVEQQSLAVQLAKIEAILIKDN